MNIYHLYRQLFQENPDRRREVYVVFGRDHQEKYEQRAEALKGAAEGGHKEITTNQIAELKDLVSDTYRDVMELKSLLHKENEDGELTDQPDFNMNYLGLDKDEQDILKKVESALKELQDVTDVNFEKTHEFYTEELRKISEVDFDTYPEDIDYPDGEPNTPTVTKERDTGSEKLTTILKTLSFKEDLEQHVIYTRHGYPIPVAPNTAPFDFLTELRPLIVREQNGVSTTLIPIEYAGIPMYVSIDDVEFETNENLGYQYKADENLHVYTLQGNTIEAKKIQHNSLSTLIKLLKKFKEFGLGTTSIAEEMYADIEKEEGLSAHITITPPETGAEVPAETETPTEPEATPEEPSEPEPYTEAEINKIIAELPEELDADLLIDLTEKTDEGRYKLKGENPISSIAQVLNIEIDKVSDEKKRELGAALAGIFKKHFLKSKTEAGTYILNLPSEDLVNEEHLDPIIPAATLEEEEGPSTEVAPEEKEKTSPIVPAADILTSQTEELFTEDLKRGAKSHTVRLVQQLLKRIGFDLGKAGADGEYGTATEQAIKEFQKRHYIGFEDSNPESGKIGDLTKKALNERVARYGLTITGEGDDRKFAPADGYEWEDENNLKVQKTYGEKLRHQAIKEYEKENWGEAQGRAAEALKYGGLTKKKNVEMMYILAYSYYKLGNTLKAASWLATYTELAMQDGISPYPETSALQKALNQASAEAEVVQAKKQREEVLNEYIGPDRYSATLKPGTDSMTEALLKHIENAEIALVEKLGKLDMGDKVALYFEYQDGDTGIQQGILDTYQSNATIFGSLPVLYKVRIVHGILPAFKKIVEKELESAVSLTNKVLNKAAKEGFTARLNSLFENEEAFKNLTVGDSNTLLIELPTDSDGDGKFESKVFAITRVVPKGGDAPEFYVNSPGILKPGKTVIHKPHHLYDLLYQLTGDNMFRQAKLDPFGALVDNAIANNADRFFPLEVSDPVEEVVMTGGGTTPAEASSVEVEPSRGGVKTISLNQWVHIKDGEVVTDPEFQREVRRLFEDPEYFDSHAGETDEGAKYVVLALGQRRYILERLDSKTNFTYEPEFNLTVQEDGKTIAVIHKIEKPIAVYNTMAHQIAPNQTQTGLLLAEANDGGRDWKFFVTPPEVNQFTNLSEVGQREAAHRADDYGRRILGEPVNFEEDPQGDAFEGPARMFMKNSWEALEAFYNSINAMRDGEPGQAKGHRRDWKVKYEALYKKAHGEERPRGALVLLGNPLTLYNMIHRAKGIAAREDLNPQAFNTGAEYIAAMGLNLYERDKGIRSEQLGISAERLVGAGDRFGQEELMSKMTPESMEVPEGKNYVEKAFAIFPNKNPNENPLIIKVRRSADGEYTVNYGKGTDTFSGYEALKVQFENNILSRILDTRHWDGLQAIEIKAEGLSDMEIQQGYREFAATAKTIEELDTNIRDRRETLAVNMAERAGMKGARVEKLRRIESILDAPHDELIDKYRKTVEAGSNTPPKYFTKMQQEVVKWYLQAACGYEIKVERDNLGNPKVRIDAKHGEGLNSGDNAYKDVLYRAAEADWHDVSWNSPQEEKRSQGNGMSSEIFGTNVEEVTYFRDPFDELNFSKATKRVGEDIYKTFLRALKKKGGIGMREFKEALNTPSSRISSLDPVLKKQLIGMVQRVAKANPRMRWGGTDYGLDNLFHKGETINDLVRWLAAYTTIGQRAQKIYKLEDYVITGDCYGCGKSGGGTTYRSRYSLADRNR